MVEVLGTLYCMGGCEKVFYEEEEFIFLAEFLKRFSLTNLSTQLNAERSAESLFNLLDVDNNGDINEEEFIRLENSIAAEKQKSKDQIVAKLSVYLFRS